MSLDICRNATASAMDALQWMGAVKQPDGTHSLQGIHRWDAFLQTWWRKKLILISDDLRVKMCIFLVNHSFNIHIFLVIVFVFSYGSRDGKLARVAVCLMHEMKKLLMRNCPLYSNPSVCCISAVPRCTSGQLQLHLPACGLLRRSQWSEGECAEFCSPVTGTRPVTGAGKPATSH